MSFVKRWMTSFLFAYSLLMHSDESIMCSYRLLCVPTFLPCVPTGHSRIPTASHALLRAVRPFLRVAFVFFAVNCVFFLASASFKEAFARLIPRKVRCPAKESALPGFRRAPAKGTWRCCAGSCQPHFPTVCPIVFLFLSAG